MLTVTGVLLIASLAASVSFAADGGQGRAAARPAAQQPPAGPAPRMANGKPDLSGLWSNPYTPNMAAKGTVLDPKTRQPLTFPRQGEALPQAAASASGNAPRTYDLPFTEWGLKQWVEYDPVKNGDYAGSCLPFGTPRNINSPHGVLITQNPDAIAFLFEQNTWFHWVPTNGMKWPADLPESWNGLSTGHWDGDTLVIETSGFNGYTKLDTSGHPHSREMKITNTFTRKDSRTIEHTFTVHDPKTYTQDWMNVRTWRIRDYPDVMMEYSCEENNAGLFDGSVTPWKRPESVD
ncbi:MAG: hypothetical protein LBE59_10400 [Nevskiaceae bacterium]|jgi:hypothetical protein|nr:hypothetical protein [Nevskiaceae bacterium]